jgi:integrase
MPPLRHPAAPNATWGTWLRSCSGRACESSEALAIRALTRLLAAPAVRSEYRLVFPNYLGRPQNPSNVQRSLRGILDRHGFEWVTTHTFRKTVATRLDEAGLSARAIADHLGTRCRA